MEKNNETIVVFSDALLDYDTRIIRQIHSFAQNYNVLVISRFFSDEIIKEYPKNVSFLKINILSSKGIALKLYNFELNKKNSIIKKGISYLLRKQFKYNIHSLFLESNKSYGDLHEQAYNFLESIDLQKTVSAIYVNDVYCLPAASLLKKKLIKTSKNKIILISDLHEAFFNYNGKAANQRIPIIRKYTKQADLMVTVSKKLSEDYINWLNYKNDTLVLNNVENYLEISPKLNNNKEKIRLVHIGVYNENRKIHEMIDIMSELDDRYTLDFYLVVYHSIEAQTKFFELNDYIENKGLQERVHIHTEIKHNEIVPTLNQYDIGIFFIDVDKDNIQYKYALPNKIFQFVQSRLAIVSTNQESIEQLVKKYDLGLTTEANYTDFIKAIEKVSLNLLEYKNNANNAAKTLNFETQFRQIEEYIKQNSSVSTENLNYHNSTKNETIKKDKSILILSDVNIDNDARVRREIKYFLNDFNVLLSSPIKNLNTNFSNSNFYFHKTSPAFEKEFVDEMYDFLKHDKDKNVLEFLEIYRKMLPSIGNCANELLATLNFNKLFDNLELVFCNDIYYLPELTSRIKRALPVSVKYWIDFHEVHFEYREKDSFDDLLRNYILDNFISKEYMYSTVSDEISRKYSQKYDIPVQTILNTPNFANYKSEIDKNYEERIDLVHVGASIINRKLENMIIAMKDLDKKYHLNLYLTYKQSSSAKKYYDELQSLTKDNNLEDRVIFHEPVQAEDLVKEISKYDIGVFYLLPEINNHNFAMPNKLFEFLQAGLAIVVSPIPSMKSFVKKYDLGYVSADNTLSSYIKNIQETSKNIIHYKKMSRKASEIVNHENEFKKVQDYIDKK